MNYYVIIETDQGYTITRVSTGKTAEMAAKEAGGILVDDALYRSFEEAEDALAAFPSPFPEKAFE
ncbi:MAG: hypothetical protein ACF8CQ_11325 [Rhodopirellula sp. JB044]|uniref:hypothetical protein n=1 Tax=Rhodopirellula sp. JB044 TaxID=3342844 RepID=UPI00370B405B